jgi:hypothetical protein
VTRALHDAVPSWLSITIPTLADISDLLEFLCCLRLAAPRRLSSIEDDRAPSPACQAGTFLLSAALFFEQTEE